MVTGFKHRSGGWEVVNSSGLRFQRCAVVRNKGAALLVVTAVQDKPVISQPALHGLIARLPDQDLKYWVTAVARLDSSLQLSGVLAADQSVAGYQAGEGCREVSLKAVCDLLPGGWPEIVLRDVRYGGERPKAQMPAQPEGSSWWLPLQRARPPR